MSHFAANHLRRELAAGLVRAVRQAERPSEAIGTAMPVQHAAVLGCRGRMLALAERREATEPVDPLGVTMVAELLEDSDSPLYQGGGDLRAAVNAARTALDGRLD